MKSVIELVIADLNPQGGIFCPSKQAGMALWNGHPRVFLNVDKTGQAKCPYCGTQFKLRATDADTSHEGAK